MRRLLARLGPPLAIVAVVLVQFAPVLRGRVYRFEDIAGYFEPLWTAVRRALAAGTMPSWVPGGWSGQPLLGDPQLGVFYPPNWIWFLLPILRAYAILALAHAAWAGLGMYSLARARGASRAGAATGGIALAVGGYVVLQVRHLMFIEATAWVPWLVLAGWHLTSERPRGGRAQWLAATALATGLMLLTGGVSMIYYGLWFALALLVPRALQRSNQATDAADVSPASAAAGLTLPSLGPRALRLAALLGALALGAALAAPMLLPMAAHGALSPRAKGTDYAFAASVAWRGIHLLPSLFLPNLLGQEVRGSYVGGGTQWEIAGYYAGMATFALAAYAVVRGPRSRRGERFAIAAICLVAILLAPGAHSPLGVHHLFCRLVPLYGAMRCPPRALYVFSLAVPLLAADGLDLLRARLAAPRPRLARALLLVPALVAADLLVTHRAENPSSTLAEARRAGRPPAVAFLEGHRGDRFVNDVHARHDLHNAGFLWNLDGASGYSSLPIWRYLHYLWIANHGEPYPHEQLADDLSAQGIWRYSSPLVDALSVRWILSEREPGPPWFRKRYAGPDGLDVWENLHALPRAWIVHRARVTDGPDAAARAIADGRFDPKEEVVLEAPPAVALRPVGAAAHGVVGFEMYAEDTAVYFVLLDEPGLLVLSEPYHPGWIATVDGAPAEMVPADYALRAIALPAGRHRVDLRFEDRPLDRGLAVGAWALAGVVLVLLAGAVLERFRRAPR